MNCRICTGNYPPDDVTYLFFGAGNSKTKHVMLHPTTCAKEMDFVVCAACMRQLSEIHQGGQSK
jgi:hypothetical protein